MAVTDKHQKHGGMHLVRGKAEYYDGVGSSTTSAAGDVDIDLTAIFDSIDYAMIQIRSDTNLDSFADADIHGLQILAGGVYASVADTIIVQPGFTFSAAGHRLKLTAAQTIEMTTAGDQRGDGIGGAYGAGAAGTYLAVYLMGQTDGSVDVVVSNVAAVTEDSVPTVNGTTDVAGAYRLIGVIPVGVGPAVSDSFTESVSGSVRRTSWLHPQGDISAAAGDPQIVALAATGDNTTELPASNIRRKCNFSVSFDPAEGAMALDDAVALSNEGSTIPLAKIVIEVAADQAQEQYVNADLITGINGQDIGVLLVTAANAHIRCNWYDTDMIIVPSVLDKAPISTIIDAADDAVAGHIKFRCFNGPEGSVVASTAITYFYIAHGTRA